MANEVLTPQVQTVMPVEKRQSLIATIGEKYGVEGKELLTTLKETVFKDASNSQLMALLIVANQFGLNPFTKEIYAFKGQGGGIVPLVGVDGWTRIVNEHPQYDGCEYATGSDPIKGEYCECTIFRKDRGHASPVREYLNECNKGTEPWKKWPHRMLRHRAFIQAARMAFGFGALNDSDDEVVIRKAHSVEATGTSAVARLEAKLTKPEPAKEAAQEVEPEWPDETEPDAPAEQAGLGL